MPEKIFFTFNFFNFPTYTTDVVTYIDAKNIDKIFNILQSILLFIILLDDNPLILVRDSYV